MFSLSFQIDAPLFSEVPVSWYNLSNISNRLFGAWLQSTTATAAANATDADNASTTSSSTTSTVVTIPPAVNATLQYLQESTVVVAEQGFTMIGGAFVQGFGLLFERLNPMLESFVNGLLDAQMSGGPPRSRAAQRRLAAAAMANPASERDLEQPEQPDYAALPPAPPARAPTSARAPSSARTPLSARGPPTHTPRGGVRPSPRSGGAMTGPANTLPTAPLPVSRSRQSTPRVPAAVELSPLSQLQHSFTSSPPHDAPSKIMAGMETTTAVETRLAEKTLVSEESETITSAAADNDAARIQEEVVSESSEPEPENAVEMDSEAATATHEEVVVDSKGSRSDTPIEDIQEHLLSLALVSKEDEEQVQEQDQPDEIAAEVDDSASISNADDNNMSRKDVDVSPTDPQTSHTEEAQLDCETEREPLGAISEAVVGDNAEDTNSSEEVLTAVQIETTDDDAVPSNTENVTVMDTSAAEETE